MTELVTTDSKLATLADEINAAYHAAEQAAETTVQHICECGRLLLRAKDQVNHGQWTPWLEANFHGTPRTAQNWMRLAKKVPELDEPNAKRVSLLSQRQALLEFREPSEGPEEPTELHELAKQFQAEVNAAMTAELYDGAVKFSPVGMTVSGPLTEEQYRETGKYIADLGKRPQRLLCELLVREQRIGNSIICTLDAYLAMKELAKMGKDGEELAVALERLGFEESEEYERWFASSE